MGKQLISSGFIAIFLIGWISHPSIDQDEYSHRSNASLSSHPTGYFFQAETDVLNQALDSFKVIKFGDGFDAIFLSTLLSHAQLNKTVPQEFNATRKELLLSFLYPAHEFS